MCDRRAGRDVGFAWRDSGVDKGEGGSRGVIRRWRREGREVMVSWLGLCWARLHASPLFPGDIRSARTRFGWAQVR